MRPIAIGLAALALLGCEDDYRTDQWSQRATSIPDEKPAPTAPASAEGNKPSSEEGASFEELGRELGAALCDKIFECCGQSEAMTLVLGPLLDRDNCPALAPFYFGDYLKKYTLSMVEQRVHYFPERVPACLQRLRSRSCADFGASLYTSSPYYPYPPYYSQGSLPPAAFACEELFAPAQQPSQLCQNDYECIDGTCVTTLGADKRCQAFSKLGQACQNYSGSYARCAQGLYCGSNGVCRTPAKDGESCDPWGTGSCEAGLYCNSNAYPYVCRPKLADGAACAGNSAACVSGRCDYTGSGYACVPRIGPPNGPPVACSGR